MLDAGEGLKDIGAQVNKVVSEDRMKAYRVHIKWFCEFTREQLKQPDEVTMMHFQRGGPSLKLEQQRAYAVYLVRSRIGLIGNASSSTKSSGQGRYTTSIHPNPPLRAKNKQRRKKGYRSKPATCLPALNTHAHTHTNALSKKKKDRENGGITNPAATPHALKDRQPDSQPERQT